MPRTMLTDEYWEKLSRLMLYSGRIYNKAEHRSTLEGILYRMRVGCPWREVPKSFGHWSEIYRRFNLWSKKGIMLELFNALKKLSDIEWEFIEGSIIKAHQHSMGAAIDTIDSHMYFSCIATTAFSNRRDTITCSSHAMLVSLFNATVNKFPFNIR